MSDTIFARASGAGRAGVAVYRISGPEAFAAVRKLAGGATPARRAALRSLYAPDGTLIDAGLVILFPGPRSFTGEDVAELHVHGARAVDEALSEALRMAGARLAEAGEFTRRALVNGKLDLAQVEGLSDLLDAETSQQRMQALGLLGGQLSALAEAWRARLVGILAALEAAIDFPDEDDVPAAIASRAGPAIGALIDELRLHLAGAARARLIREGVAVVLVGAPNAGKSSLLNRLAGAERAIVAPTPGTTRDVIEARLDLGGMVTILADTAGLRETAGDQIEDEGVRRARSRAQDADVRILVMDAALGMATAPADEGWSLLRPGDFVLFNKSDLTPGDAAHLLNASLPAGVTGFAVSALTGAGLDAFSAALTRRVCDLAHPGDAGGPVLIRERHRQAVLTAIDRLGRAQAAVSPLGPTEPGLMPQVAADIAPELAAEDVRLAARALGRITGAVDVEEVLGEIFARFCIGK